MDGHSLDIVKQMIGQLKQIIPEAFTEGKIDWEKLRIALGEDINFNNERYVLNWAGKSDAYRLLQTPTYATLKPAREESVNFDMTENVFIEGDNLEVLKVLQKSYFGKIKMIYIDPPYNTGNDFIYKDDFSETLNEYRERVGDIDENGNATKSRLFRNSKDSGRYHSNWLSMMLPRLFLARNLLRDDGVIFVSIDDNEVHNLRLLMDEIFGEENFVEAFIWRSRLGKGATSKVSAKLHEYIVVYGKNKEQINFLGDIRITALNKKERIRQWGQGDRREDRPTLYYPVFSKEFGWVYPKKQDKTDGRWRIGKISFEKLQQKGLVVFEKLTDGRVEAYRIIPTGTQTETAQGSILDPEKVKTTAFGSKEISALFDKNIFDYPKPTKLLRFLLELINDNRAVILDFFAGSGTTAQAVMELNKEDGGNRKFILVQLPEPCDTDSEAYKAGFMTISDICKERIRRVSNKIKQELEEETKKKQGEIQFEPVEERQIDLGFKVFKLSESNFKQWRPFQTNDAEKVKRLMLDFVDNIKQDATVENMLYELMLKNGNQLTELIENKDGYYFVGKNEIVFILETINEAMIEEILKLKPQKVIVLDKLFKGNDQLKTNTYLQFKDAGVEFKSV